MREERRKEVRKVKRIEKQRVKSVVLRGTRKIGSEESETFEGKPYSFMNFYFRKDGIELEYALTPEVNEKKREVDVCKMLFGMLALSESYELELGPLYELAHNALEHATEFIEVGYEELKSKYDELLEKSRRNEEELKKAIANNEKSEKLLLEAEKLNEALKERQRKLEGMSDEVLLDELVRWIKVHNGRVNVVEFAEMNKVAASRVEEGLDKLLREGYIRRVSA